MSAPRRNTHFAATALGASALAVVGALLVGGSGPVVADAPRLPEVQDEFDSLGPDVHAAKLPSGRTAHYTDAGPRDGRPVLFIGGTGTSARAQHMTDFFASTRDSMGLRLISVERNGFGDTEFDPALGKADFVSDALAVLDRLDVEKVSVIAISGGGPYAAELAARAPERVRALHLAAALPPYGAKPEYCALSDEALADALGPVVKDPRKWWAMPDDSPAKSIPGFADTAYEEGARTFNQRGQQGDVAPQVHEQRLYCDRPGPDLSGLKAPAFLYAGEKDTTVPPSTLDAWRAALPGEEVVRRYADTGHDVQYRHWDQILADLAGHGDRTVVCRESDSELLPAREADRLVEEGEATLGSCAWQ
ncbi:alpha/beta fold hydrolase [Streptomyces cavernicola]|uniref:Alpha/beta hydrolase n=1 Tax=Streptomyces cavernicola TaxID=3043613 RepID=A0ABT6S8P3_9ACTN|nr:alpha/beta hydrolase [Streptomyces sp. B-S-A6]MDI3404464.1 alpha/beta hydrolase [Streptomyces sp. B-S-A6]